MRISPPGHYYLANDKKFHKYYNPKWDDEEQKNKIDFSYELLKNSLEEAVKRQLMCDVPYGLLISGGIDSSIVAAIAKKFKAKRIETDDLEPAWWPQLHSFSIGLKGSPDLKYARMVADHIGTVHHELNFTVQEGFDALSDVIYHLETFDVTTIRASTPMYLMARVIKSMGIKMVLSGEGADEIFGGYLYFHKAPNEREFHEELLRKLKKLYMFDCLRANKSTAAWGVEARVPFLDKEFLHIAMSIPTSEKLINKDKMEKYILRKAFEGYIPEEVLWRQKEQFSDGVGYDWIGSLKKLAEEKVSDKMLKDAKHRFPIKTPLNKEEYFYRSIFEKHFPNPSAAECVPTGPSIACSTPTAIKWDKAFEEADPSGLAVKTVHNETK